jgi:hypothetical protein
LEALPENSIEAFLDEGIEQTNQTNAAANKNAEMLHRVFVQNEYGAELLAKWKNDLIMIPSVLPESSQFGAGLTEGGKMFVRNIITLIQSVENEL